MKRLAIAALALAACGGKSPQKPIAPPPNVTPAPAPPPAPHADALPLPANVPDTTAGHQLAWVLDTIANPDHASADAATAHFDASFLKEVPAEKIVAITHQLAAQLKGAVVDKAQSVDDTKLAVRLVAGNLKMVVQLGVDPASKKIAGLLFQPDTSDRPTSWDEVTAAAKKLAPRASFLLASLEDKGACKPLRSLAPTDELAIGSATKLYILLGLVDQTIAGKLKWEQELAVEDQWKSLPSGITQDDPAGTKLTVQTLAERMISISDNTATDHLLHTVGRANVEKALVTAKHSKPALNIPFMGTRDLFELKLGATEDEVVAFVKLKPAARRAYIEKTLAKKPLPPISKEIIEAWTKARHITDVEWFASPTDLCGVMSALRARSTNPKAAPLLDVLSKNPGLPLDKKDWSFIGFKGGSEPGVINLTFLLKRADGRWFFASFGWNGDDPVDENGAAAVAQGAIELLAKE